MHTSCPFYYLPGWWKSARRTAYPVQLELYFCNWYQENSISLFPYSKIKIFFHSLALYLHPLFRKQQERIKVFFLTWVTGCVLQLFHFSLCLCHKTGSPDPSTGHLGPRGVLWNQARRKVHPAWLCLLLIHLENYFRNTIKPHGSHGPPSQS